MGLFTSNGDGKHRRRGKTVTTLRRPDFQPRHCAGALESGLCLSHDHPGDAFPLTNFARLNEPVVLPERLEPKSSSVTG
jgi:hypothetical protein